MTDSAHNLPAAHWLRVGGDFVLIGLATFSAWPFAGADPYPEYLLTLGVLLLTACWGAHAHLTRRFHFRLDLVSAALAALILLNVAQLAPLPTDVVAVLSPARAEWNQSLLPDQLERLPGESDSFPRAGSITLSVDPDATRTLIGRLIALFAVYSAARNWLADRFTLRRFAWAAMLNGVALALFALGQFFSSKPGVAFGAFDVGGSVFGPFVCRNHYPDFLAFGIAGAICLLHPPPGERRRKSKDGSGDSRWQSLFDLFDRPASLTAAFALGLMLASIPFSQSRGGVVAMAVAGVGTAFLAGREKQRGGPLTTAVGAAAAVLGGLILWLGVGPIQERFKVDDPRTLDDRTPLWAAAAKQLPGLWAGGSGGGSFVWVEPLGRTDEPSRVIYEHAHNEYLEAAVEGGVVRLALTLLLAIGVPVVLGRAYRRLRGRSAGGFVLGVWFAVIALVVHSAVDFGIHLPAVALAATTAVGLAMGASRQVAVRESSPPDDEEPAEPSTSDRPPPKHGLAVLILPAVLAMAVLVAAIDARNRWRAERFRVAALVTMASESGEFAARIGLQTGRTAVAPTDPTAWFGLAQAHLDAAVAERTPDGFSPDTVRNHILPALAALRTARGLNPLYPEVQFRLGLYARYFEQAEPPLAYFHRARRLLPSDPDVWYACGVEELAAGDRPAAEASWRRSLTLGPGRLKPILKALTGLSAEALRDRVLPDDPAVLMAAADERPAAERLVFVEPAADAVRRDVLNVQQRVAAATACDELGSFDDTAAMWNRATAEAPGNRELRNAAARWFEQQEMYADAVPHLEWLVDRSPNDRALRDRLAAARHGAELKQIIRR